MHIEAPIESLSVTHPSMATHQATLCTLSGIRANLPPGSMAGIELTTATMFSALDRPGEQFHVRDLVYALVGLETESAAAFANRQKGVQKIINALCAQGLVARLAPYSRFGPQSPQSYRTTEQLETTCAGYNAFYAGVLEYRRPVNEYRALGMAALGFRLDSLDSVEEMSKTVGLHPESFRNRALTAYANLHGTYAWADQTINRLIREF